MKNDWFVQIKEKLNERYRFVVLNNTTFEEKTSKKFTLSSLFVMAFLTFILLIAMIISLIAFTPLREYIPGYGSAKQSEKIWQLTKRLDSLEQIYTQYNYYEQGIRTIFSDNIPEIEEDSLNQEKYLEPLDNSLHLTKFDSLLLSINSMISEKQETNIIPKDKMKPSAIEDILFFSPIKGIVVSNYAQEQGIFLNTKQKTPVYAPKSGTIVLNEINANGEQLLVIHHPHNILSIFHLHNSNVTITTGQTIKEKQLLAVLNTDQKVHYELWIDGTSVNPQDYILF